jgi:hypothetical protein
LDRHYSSFAPTLRHEGEFGGKNSKAVNAETSARFRNVMARGGMAIPFAIVGCMLNGAAQQIFNLKGSSTLQP